MKVLVVDDQRSARKVLRHMLCSLQDVQVLEASSVSEARQAVEAQPPDVLLVDIRLSDDPTDRGGLDFLQWVRARGDSTPTVMVTNSSEMAEIREAMRHGAQDYVLKDELCPEMLLPIVNGFRERLAMRGELQRLRQRLEPNWGLSALVGSSQELERARRLVQRVADADAPVLIRGPTGSGKELVARAIHECSHRASAPFLAVNCSALPGTLIESMIFGHLKGAFTGADRRVRGQLELAGEGTLLLDEIAEMPVQLQAKLLRVLEDRRFRPLGSETEQPLRARILAATHVDLESHIAEGKFREDLFYRLNVVSVELPALSQRTDDIVELLYHFNTELSLPLRFTDAAIEWIKRRPWPGNVRELRNAVERLALLGHNDEVDVPELEELVGLNPQHTVREIDKMARSLLALPSKLGSKLDMIERAVLHHAIETCGGNKSAAARLVGVDRKALDRRWGRLSDVPEAPEDEG